MELTKRDSATTRRVRLRRITASAVAVVGLSAFVLAPEAAQASSHSTKSVVISTANDLQVRHDLVSGHTLYILTPSKSPVKPVA